MNTYKFVSVDGHVLLERGPVIENLGARLKMALKNSR
jgi:hypothetical protein